MKLTGLSLAIVATLLTLSQAEQLGQITNECQSCIKGVESVSNRVSSQYRDFVILKDHVCGQIPAVGQPTCEQLLEASNPIIRKALAQPVQTCERLGACSKKEEVFTLLHDRQVGDDITCPICEYLVVYIKEQLKDPETEAQLIDQATQLCQLLPDDTQAECLKDVAQYSEQIFTFIDESDPQEICELASLCDPALALPELPESLKQKTGSVFAVQNGAEDMGDDDQCNTCKLVIVQASSALADPETQKEILDYVKQQCGDFQAFKDQCEAYIALYGPLAINMARQYLSPALCDQLGFCTPSVSSSLPFSA